MTANRAIYEPTARNAAFQAGIDPDLFVRQIQQESGFDPDAYNRASGATGIGQIIARFHPDVDPHDPVASLYYAARWMASLRRQFGSYRKALAAYNWGPGNVGGYTRPDGVVIPPWNGERSTLPAETQHYLDVILGPDWPEPGGAPVPTVIYNRAEPTISQNDPWSCAPTSTRWAMMAVGRHPTEAWMESQMLSDGIVSKAEGLLDASGHDLAVWITEQYGEFGYYANNEPRGISFDALAAEFMATHNPYPGLIGGSIWNHWSGLRTYDPQRDVLLLANPSEGWHGVGATMDRAQFAAQGPFSLVRVLHPDLLAPSAPPPVPAPIPLPPVTRADLDREIAHLTMEITHLTAIRDRLPV